MNSRFVVVIGETKAGTSSLYHYLGSHPEVTPTVQKQTDFFLDNTFSGQTSNPDPKFVETEYLKRFRPQAINTRSVRLDVSPDYMYSKEAIDSLSDFMNGRDYLIVVILRNPVDRLLSWFQFGKQLGLLEKQLSFSEYLNKQDANSSNPALRARDTGKFLTYLEPLGAKFNSKQIKYYSFDALKSNPMNFMKQIAKDIELNSQFYESYEFHQHNKTQEVRSASLQKLYISIQRFVYKAISNNNSLNRLTSPLLSLIGRTFRHVNAIDKNAVEISETELTYLHKFYSSEIGFLENGMIKEFGDINDFG